MFRASLIFAGIALTQSTVMATVAISFNADSLRTSIGDFAPADTLAMLIADADGFGFGSISEGSINQYDVVGSGDVVVARFDFSNAGPGLLFEDAGGIDLTGFGEGDQLAIVWFPGLTTAATSVNASQSYGLLTDSSWVVPADGGSNPTQYQVITTTNQNVFTPNVTTLLATDIQSQASLQVVPEPQTYAMLAGLATLGFAAVRRRKQRR